MYIRVFILASDIDDAVEEKLLVGDKPKVFALTPETRDTVKERVAEKKDEELVDVRSLSSRREFTILMLVSCVAIRRRTRPLRFCLRPLRLAHTLP